MVPIQDVKSRFCFVCVNLVIAYMLISASDFLQTVVKQEYAFHLLFRCSRKRNITACYTPAFHDRSSYFDDVQSCKC